MKNIILLLFGFLLAVNLVAAQEVGYIYQGDLRIDQNVIGVFSDMGFTTVLIEADKLPDNLSDYAFLFVGHPWHILLILKYPLTLD